jgi:hypothetical protein
MWSWDPHQAKAAYLCTLAQLNRHDGAVNCVRFSLTNIFSSPDPGILSI